MGLAKSLMRVTAGVLRSFLQKLPRPPGPDCLVEWNSCLNKTDNHEVGFSVYDQVVLFVCLFLKAKTNYSSKVSKNYGESEKLSVKRALKETQQLNVMWHSDGDPKTENGNWMKTKEILMKYRLWLITECQDWFVNYNYIYTIYR